MFTIVQEVALTRQAVWRLLSETDALNRTIGLPIVRFEAPQGGGAVRPASARVANAIPMRWKEHPFQWVKDRWYSVKREYSSGPMKLFVAGIELEDSPTPLPKGGYGTIIKLWADVTPAHPWGMPLISLTIRDSMQKTRKACLDFLLAHEDATAGLAIHTVLSNAPTKTKVNLSELEAGLKQLQKLPLAERLTPLLREYLVMRDDNSVAQIRPHRLSREWGVSTEEALRFCLFATKAGLMNLRWTLLCPNCRVGKAEFDTLRDVQEKVHCDLCGVYYDVNFDRYVELRFSVHPVIRQAEANTYCMGGPAVTPHVWTQKNLSPGEQVRIPFPEEASGLTGGQLRLRVLRHNHKVNFTPAMVPAATINSPNCVTALNLNTGGWEHTDYPAVAPGQELAVQNNCEEEVIVALEQTDWDADVVTAALVTSMQEFRDLFSSEVLAPGHQVGVESLTVFFSDLRNSTVLYENAGDAPAYGYVRRHFEYMTKHISAHGGSVVKTIGDAVMATFYTPEGALRASLAIQENVSEINKGLLEGEYISVKIGLHYGPAIVVNFNDRLDYFGRTINIAARVETASMGDDIVMSRTCYLRPGIVAMLEAGVASQQITVQTFTANLKGIVDEFQLYRIRPRHEIEIPEDITTPALTPSGEPMDRRASDRRRLEI